MVAGVVTVLVVSADLRGRCIPSIHAQNSRRLQQRYSDERLLCSTIALKVGALLLVQVLAVVTEFIDPEASEGAIRRAVLTVEDSLSGRKSGAQLLLQGSIGDDGADLAEAAEQVGSQPLKGDALPGGGASVATSAVSPYNNMPTPGDMTAKYPGACKQNPPPQVPDVKVERLWHSNKLRKLTDVTLVTQLSIDRLPALELQCSVWGGVISAAVYVPLVDDSIVSEDERLHGTGVPKAIAIVDTFHDKQETQGKCKLDMLLVTEDAVSLKYVGLYPVNALRNRALMMAKTDIILILDADFVPNLSLSEDLDNPQMYDQLHRATSARQLIILPAFQVLADGEEGRRLALKAIESKEDVVRMMQNARAQGFHMDGFVNGHRSTDFDRWQTAEIAYRVQYEEGFEPYVMAQRQFVPWYDGEQPAVLSFSTPEAPFIEASVCYGCTMVLSPLVSIFH